jgi:hypothetical protein
MKDVIALGAAVVAVVLWTLVLVMLV